MASSSAFIPLLEVLPTRQRHGIGSELVRRIAQPARLDTVVLIAVDAEPSTPGSSDAATSLGVPAQLLAADEAPDPACDGRASRDPPSAATPLAVSETRCALERRYGSRGRDSRCSETAKSTGAGHSVGSARAGARRHHDPPARAGAARGARCRPRSCSGSPRSSTAAGFAYLEVSGGGVFDSGGPPRRREPVGADPRAQGADEDAARAGAARPLPRRLAARRRRLRRAASSPRRPRTASTSSACTTR